MINQLVDLDYTNYRGERSIRRIKPIALFWGSTEWHKHPQWLLDVWDEAKGQRAFAMASIHSWRAVS